MNEAYSDDVIDQPWPTEFAGWNACKFVDYTVKTKETGAWLLLKFVSAAGGDQASWDGNLFTSQLTDGRKTANKITMGGLSHFFRACGLADSDFPKQSVAAIDKALAAFKGGVTVDAKIGKDDKGFNRAMDFRKSVVAA